MNTLDSVRKAPHSKTMGIEIEAVFDVRYDDDWVGFFYKGTDGSIQRPSYRQYGYEFVSQPLTYEWMHRELGKLYKKILPYGMSVNSSCGIHIHVSKAWFSDKKANAVQKFLTTLTNEEMHDLFGRRPNHYCDPLDSPKSRYNAVNTTNATTNELRMFCSGDLKWAKYCVDCAKYMVENAYHLNIDAFTAFQDQPKYKDI